MIRFLKTSALLLSAGFLLAACTLTPSKDDADLSPSLQSGRSKANKHDSVSFEQLYNNEGIFQRIRNGFAMNDITDDLVLAHQQRYMNNPESLRRIIGRSSRYLYYIVSEIDRRGMPMELALLPIVESAFNPKALSSAKAAGLWQFIPSTGKRFNLSQTWWRDDRRDVIASTQAALDYLQLIYEMHGDWHLALASYNWGEGAVGRAVNKNQAIGLPTDFLSLKMPDETRNYVPKLQALKNIINNPALVAELGLPKVANTPYFGTIHISSNIDVKMAARLASISEEEFTLLNPSHHRPVILANSLIVLPEEQVEVFKSRLAAHDLEKEPLSSWKTYTVEAGEKLEKIAPRFGMSVANLKAINGLTRSQVAPGQMLLVPGSGEIALNAMAEMKVQETTRAPETYVVKKGDTLGSIAKKNGVSAKELLAANRLKTAAVKAGMSLKIPAKERVVVAAANNKPEKGRKEDRNAAKSDKSDKKAKPKAVTYSVKKGDTISSIARRFAVKEDAVLKANRLKSKNIKAGQELVIP